MRKQKCSCSMHTKYQKDCTVCKVANHEPCLDDMNGLEEMKDILRTCQNQFLILQDAIVNALNKVDDWSKKTEKKPLVTPTMTNRELEVRLVELTNRILEVWVRVGNTAYRVKSLFIGQVGLDNDDDVVIIETN